MGTRRDLSAILADGRRLGYAEWGATSGPVVIDFHGGPGCRLIPSGSPDVLAVLGWRWITVDRPGLGLSDPKLRRTVADWADDIEELADALGLGRFSVVGWSMGGPYAAAVAARLTDRVVSVALLGPAPVSLGSGDITGLGKVDYWNLVKTDPWAVANLYLALGIAARKAPETAVEAFSLGCSAPEIASLQEPVAAAMFIDTMIEATRQGPMGLVQDALTELAPWGFDPATITAPTHVWESTDDSFSLPGVADGWAAAIPNAQVHTLTGQGHLFPITHATEIVGALQVSGGPAAD